MDYVLHVIVLPIPKKEIESILPLTDVLQRALVDFSGEFSFHYLYGNHGIFFRRRTFDITFSSISNAPVYYTDGLSSGKVELMTPP